jgi:hypothetical protein
MAITLQGWSSTDWARAANTTLAKYMRDVENDILRNFQMLALLESNGRVTYNNGGRGFTWPIQFKLHRVEGNTGETVRQFSRVNLWKWANLDYRGYQVTDAIYNRELLENRGQEGVIKIWDGFVDRLQQSLRQGLATEPYIDGNATGNETSWHGLESIFGINGTINVSTGAQRTATAADYVGYPSDTYAGLSTILGNYGGENESAAVWPDGVADPEYDFWSPLVVNAKSSAFSGTGHTFADQGDEAIRFANIHSQRNTLTNGQVTNAFLSRDFFYSFLNLIDGKERILVSRGGENGLTSLGFKNVVQFDGIDISWEAAIPSATAYGINLANIELMSMDDTLFRPEGPEYDLRQQSYIAVVSTLSNLKFASPRNFWKVANLT